MRHFFMEIDGMTVTYGDIVEERLCDTIPYYVERDDGEGDFDFAQGSLPTCTPVKSKGFSESELWDIESLMRDNMHNIYDQIRGEGAWALERDVTKLTRGGDAVYGVMFDLDTHTLEDELGISRNDAYRSIERKLEELGYIHVQYSVYVCPHPRTNEMLVVHETIEALKELEWFSPAVSRIIAFKLESWGDLIESFR